MTHLQVHSILIPPPPHCSPFTHPIHFLSLSLGYLPSLPLLPSLPGPLTIPFLALLTSHGLSPIRASERSWRIERVRESEKGSPLYLPPSVSTACACPHLEYHAGPALDLMTARTAVRPTWTGTRRAVPRRDASPRPSECRCWLRTVSIVAFAPRKPFKIYPFRTFFPSEFCRENHWFSRIYQ